MINGEKAPWRLLPLLLVQRFSYRQLLYVVTIRSVLAAIKGRFIGWGKLSGLELYYTQQERIMTTIPKCTTFLAWLGLSIGLLAGLSSRKTQAVR